MKKSTELLKELKRLQDRVSLVVELEKRYVGKVIEHTAKGRARVHCPTRVYPVVSIDDGSASDDGRPALIAWKVEALPDGRFYHPAYPEPLDKLDKRAFVDKGSNGSDPTAAIVLSKKGDLDSFYQFVGGEEIKE